MGKYDLLENTDRRLANYSIIVKPPEIVPKPLNVILKAIPIINDTITSYTLEVSWTKPLRNNGTFEDYVTSYLVEISRNNGIYGSTQEILENPVRIARYENVGTGEFKARVAAKVSINNKTSLWQEIGSSTSFFPVNANLDLTNSDSFWFD